MQEGQVFPNQSFQFDNIGFCAVACKIQSLACFLGFICPASALNILEILLKCFSANLVLDSVAIL